MPTCQLIQPVLSRPGWVPLTVVSQAESPSGVKRAGLAIPSGLQLLLAEASLTMQRARFPSSRLGNGSLPKPEQVCPLEASMGSFKHYSGAENHASCEGDRVFVLRGLEERVPLFEHSSPSADTPS